MIVSQGVRYLGCTQFILRDLQEDGLISRTVHPTTPPSTEYALTDLGRSLVVPLTGVLRWAEEHHEAIKQARRNHAAAEHHANSRSDSSEARNAPAA